ncbi:KpsF/GutQ family sugar-phosphate isomerase [Oleiharenicola lentus]|uniref:KpsF/GutQ family sugar-phosphate isomerase n=1 Tax=Oleiharenicola lentus TaxID=2508720 RepID=UPI003F66A692
MPLDDQTILAKARNCFVIEREALDATAVILNQDFVAVVRAVETVIAGGHKLIISGVGKNAHIAQKLTGTFNSTGVPTCFLDPTQALHGDLGLCAEGDLVLLLSNSGASREMLQLLPLFERFGLKTVAMTGSPESELARGANYRLIYRAPREACPLELAPTASTTATLALGDALAMVLLESRGLTREDFAKYHPAGTLGMTLLLRVKDIMRTGAACPVLNETGTTVQEAIFTMTKAKAGAVALVDAQGVMTGIFTDGDFRRCALSGAADFLQKQVADYMTRNPRSVSADVLAVEALKIFQQFKISDLMALDAQKKPVGYIDVQDLPKLKIL